MKPTKGSRTQRRKENNVNTFWIKKDKEEEKKRVMEKNV